MHSLALYIKPILIATLIGLQTSVSILVAQDKTSHTIIDLYRQSINEESTLLYQQALQAYQATPREIVHYSDNKQLCKQYHKLASLADSTAEQINTKIEALHHLSTQAGEQKEIGLQLKSLTDAFELAFWKTPPSYSTAFILALEMEYIMDKVTEETYSEQRASYFKLGEAYYLFNEFEKALEVLKKGISEQKPKSFTDRANLDSRKIIGICYANLGQIDISDYYFRSILESKDLILDRPIYNAYALSYLGCNAMIRGDYGQALALDSEVLSFFRSYTDYGHVAGMYYCRASCYAATKNMEDLQIATDSILHFANQDSYNRDKRRKQAFRMLAHYHALKGDSQKTKIYSDSLVAIYQSEANEHTWQYIANAHQFILNGDIEKAESKADNYRYKLTYSIIAFIIVILSLIYIINLYRRRQEILKTLIEKNIELAHQEDENSKSLKDCVQTRKADTTSNEDEHIMLLLKEYILDKKNFNNPSLSLADISTAININRSYLSRAINNVTGDGFKSYINQLRIYESIKIMNSKRGPTLSLDTIAHKVGFSGRTTFYTNFKKVTGLTPSEFKNNL